MPNNEDLSVKVISIPYATGFSNYNDLVNKPQIATELIDGLMSSEDKTKLNNYPNVDDVTPGQSLGVDDLNNIVAVYDEVINLALFGISGDDNLTDYAKIMNVLWVTFDGNNNTKKLKFTLPGGKYNLLDTLYIPKGVVLEGVNTDDPYSADRRGTILTSYGVGVGRRWSDVDGNDSIDYKPVIVLCGSDTILQNLTVETDNANRWDCGILIPSVRRVQLINVDTAKNFKHAGVLLDATWSNLNTTLTSLHPRVISDTGCNEFSATACFFKGRWGFVCQGTTRDPDDIISYPVWLWSWGGTSDQNFHNCRFGTEGISSELATDGGGYKHDAALRGGAEAGQGIYFWTCSFRVGARYMVYLNSSNRVVFVGNYGETLSSWTSAGNPSATFYLGPKIEQNNLEVMRLADRLNADIEDSTGRYTVGNHRWTKSRPVHILRTDGRLSTSNLYFMGTNTSVPTRLISSFDTANRLGELEFAKRDPITSDVSIYASIKEGSFTLGDNTLYSSKQGSNLFIDALDTISIVQDYHRIDTFDNNLASNLVNIDGGQNGQTVILRPTSSSRLITLKHNLGNIRCHEQRDILLSSTDHLVILTKVSSVWLARHLVIGTKRQDIQIPLNNYSINGVWPADGATVNNLYSWSQDERGMVDVQAYISSTLSGTGNSQIIWDLPLTMPLPSPLINANSNLKYLFYNSGVGRSYLSDTGTSGNTITGGVRQNNSALNGWQFVGDWTSNNSKNIEFRFSYRGLLY